MWKYVKRYLVYGILAAFFMVGEVLMDLLQPEIMSQIVDEGVLGLSSGGISDIQLIWILGIRMIGIVLFGGLFGSLCSLFSQLIGQNVGNDIRKDCFRSMMSFSFTQIDHFGTGSLITRVTNDITHVQTYVTVFVRSVVRMVMLMFGSVFFIAQLNRQFGLIVSGAVPFILICLIFCLAKGNPLFMKLQAQLDRINGIMQEDVSGMRIIKACVREIYEKVRFGKANDDLIKTQLQVLVIFSFMNPIINALMYLVIALILLAGSYQHAGGGATPGDIMAAITYTTRLLNGILMLVMISQNISRGITSWKRLKEVLECEPELQDGMYAGEKKSEEAIEFRDVSFAYPGSNRMVLEHINFKVHHGETLAIMGATGSGKTTLANLIPRFYDVTEGTVLIDGVDVREYSQKALRERIAAVLQKSELFSESVSDNIAWGNPEAKADEIKRAAMTAQADGFVSEMANGYETVIAERGTSLSGGQKQRMSIARAVIKPAEILIFDDSTSALDLKTEAHLYEALQQSRPEATKIVIAQRIATVKRADRIVVLENGRVAGVGTHKELLKSCRIYQDIYYSQMGKEGENDA